MAPKKTTAKHDATRFVQEVLDVREDAAISKKLGKALGVGKRAAPAAVSSGDVVALLGDRIDASKPPAWVVWSGGGTLDDVVHLDAPMLVARGADEDEFFHEPGAAQLIVDERGKGMRLTKDGDATDTKLAVADVAKLTAFNAGGFLLRDLRWLGAPPKTVGDATKLLAKARDAYSGDLAAYEAPARGPADVKKTATKPVEPATVADRGTAVTWLGGPARTGSFDVAVPRKEPKLAWSCTHEENGGAENGGNPVVDATLGLVFAAEGGFNAKCSATRLEDGKSAWKTELTKKQSWPIGSAVVDAGVIYQATNKNLFALDAKTGKQRWAANLTTVAGSPLVLGDLVFIGTGEGVLGLSVANGRKQWAFAVKRDKYKNGVIGGVACEGGTLFFVAEEKLFAVDVATKKKLWTSPSVGRAVPSVDESAVYTWSRDGLTCVDRKTGAVKWAQNFSGDHYDHWKNTVAVAQDRVVTRASGKLVAVDKANGKVLWSVATKRPYSIGCSSPILAGDVALCILVEEDADNPVLFAVDLAKGKLLWKRDKFPLRKNERAPLSYYCTPAIAPDGKVLVQAYGLHALR